MTMVREEQLSGATVIHAIMPPHAPSSFTSVTPPHSMGVSFTGHRRAVRKFETAPTQESRIAPGAMFVTMSADLHWLDVAEPSEALEIRIEPSYVQRVADELGASRAGSLGDVGGKQDHIVWAICAAFRASLHRDSPMDSLIASERLYALVAHALHTYGSIVRERRRAGRLDPKRLARVAEYVDAHLGERIVLEQLSAAAALSPFHFARSFRATTQLTPYEFVTARRMELARRLLGETSLSTAGVASQVGYSNVAHFREQFVRAFGARPSAVRALLIRMRAGTV